MNRFRVCAVVWAVAVLSLHSFGQGCNGWMTKNYNTYVSSSNPNGNLISTSVIIDGSSGGVCPFGCGCSGVTHTPRAYNKINTTGGYVNGPSGPYNSYISATNNQQIAAAPGVLYPFTWEGDIICSAVGTFFTQGGNGPPVAGFTPVQHNYPNNPLSKLCHIGQFFDHIGYNKTRHNANDVDYAGATHGLTLGDPVYTAEGGGTVKSITTGQPTASQPYPQCQGLGYKPNSVVIQEKDGYTTTYAHITAVGTLKVGSQVSAGQQIGTVDASGCQQVHHVHMARHDSLGHPVNFTVPCDNMKPTNSFWDPNGPDDDDLNI